MNKCTGKCEQGRRCTCGGAGEWYGMGAICGLLILLALWISL